MTGGAPSPAENGREPPGGHVLPEGPLLPWARVAATAPADGARPPSSASRSADARRASRPAGDGSVGATRHPLPAGSVLPGAGDLLLEVEDLSAGYGDYRALFGVSLSVPTGGIVAVLGPNGAGKSTLARTLSGLVRASAGRVRLAGQDITGLPAHQITRRGLVHVPEGRGVFASLTVEENLLVSFGGRLPRSQVHAALDRAYASFGVLAERRRQLAGTLSGGQQRLLSLAKVLAAPARLLVVDELSLGLAPAVVDAVYDGLVAIRAEGTSLLVVEQQVDRALGIADGAVVLSHGRVTWQGPAAEAMAAAGSVLAPAEGGPGDGDGAPADGAPGDGGPADGGPGAGRSGDGGPGAGGGVSMASPPGSGAVGASAPNEEGTWVC